MPEFCKSLKMKGFLISLYICVFALSVNGEPQHRRGGHHHSMWNGPLKESFLKCMEEKGISKDQLKEMRGKNDTDAHCLAFCSFKKEGMVDDDGSFDEKKIEEVLKPLIKEQNLEKLPQMVHDCGTKVNNIEEKCGKINAYSRCASFGMMKIDKPRGRPEKKKDEESKKDEEKPKEEKSEE